MRGLHGKRPGVQVGRAPEGACGGPRPSRGAVPGSWPGGPGAIGAGAEEQVKGTADAVTFRKSPQCASWTC